MVLGAEREVVTTNDSTRRRGMSKKDIVVSCLTFLCAFALVGCASVHVDRVGTFDFSEKTICVPPGYGLALGPVKRGLRASGWKIFSIAKGKDVTVKDGGSVANNGNEQERMETEWDARARYRMLFWSAQVDVDLMFNPIYNFELSILDNRTGEEILCVSGTRCSADEIVNELRKQLQD